MDFIRSALGAGMTWADFLDVPHYVAVLHIEADVKRWRTLQEMLAWHATHTYRAICGDSPTVDELLGRVRQKIDFVNDPNALDKLADWEGG